MQKISPQELNECLSFNSAVFVFVQADWCTSCHQFIPLFEDLERMYRTYVRFVILDYDENKDLLKQMDIQITPSVLLFKKAKLVQIIQGTQSKEKYEASIISQLL